MNSQMLRRIIFIGLFAIPFVPFLVSSAFFFPFIVTKAFTWRIIVEIIFATWILLALFDANYRPKKSLILYSVLSFLVVIGLADLFGVAPVKSFWSNFERMEGFISLVHLGAFFVVIGSMFKEIDWKRWWNTSLVASVIMAFYALFQVIGVISPNQAGARVDGTFGNTIYLAVYMLFHIFVATLFMWREWKNTALRWVYGLVILFQLFILYHTATRGAILGLLGGVLIVALVSMFNKSEGGKVARKAGVVILLALVVLVGGFFALRDAEFMRNSPVLSRFSSLTTEELKTQGRYFVWPIAWQGFKERPLLGWGQENFNYVFNKHYLPEMYHLEPWFDRAHNIFLDWAVAGGLLGLISYLALYVALLFSIWKRGTAWSHAEKSILTGLVAAYFFHNFFVFDHLVSYILFFSLLAYVHHVSGSEISPKKTLTQVQVRNIALPVVSILLLLSLYFVNIKPIIGNVYLIEAIKSLQTPGEIKAATQHLQSAYGASRLGRPETVEQLAVRSVSILSSEEISIEEKNDFFSFTNSAMLKETQNFPDDARTQLLAGSLFSSVSSADESLVYLERARLLMPNKQQIYFEIGAAYINKNEPLRALEIFKEAFELAPQYIQAQKVYLVGAIYAGDRVVESEMIDKLTEREVVFDDQIINAYYTNKRLDRIVSLLEDRIRLDPDNADGYRELIEQVRQ